MKSKNEIISELCELAHMENQIREDVPHLCDVATLNGVPSVQLLGKDFVSLVPSDICRCEPFPDNDVPFKHYAVIDGVKFFCLAETSSLARQEA